MSALNSRVFRYATEETLASGSSRRHHRRWLTFDGAHALITGDFVTPGSGAYAGQLRPWTVIPRAFGLDPRSVGVKLFFLIFGVTYVAALAVFVLRRAGSWLLLVACTAIALLYLPVGTLLSVVALGILATLQPRRTDEP